MRVCMQMIVCSLHACMHVCMRVRVLCACASPRTHAPLPPRPCFVGMSCARVQHQPGNHVQVLPVYVCMCLHVYTGAWVYACTYACMYLRCACAHGRVYDTYACKNGRMYACVHACHVTDAFCFHVCLYYVCMADICGRTVLQGNVLYRNAVSVNAMHPHAMQWNGMGCTCIARRACTYGVHLCVYGRAHECM